MSRLTDLLQRVSKLDPLLGAELRSEYQSAINSRNYGLVFEKHQPEAVDLPLAKPHRGSTVRILPSRSEGTESKVDGRLWTVQAVTKGANGNDERSFTLVELDTRSGEREVRENVLGENLVVVSKFQDTIYPGLVQTGEVNNSNNPDNPAQVVINAENYHALQVLTYTHKHAIDVIYIDPPYNTGAKDWKYNNNYVGTDDAYRHSKWLSFMERRLKIAKELLNPSDSVLIITIDEKEYLRLGLLLDQVFPGERIQMVSVGIRPSGNSRGQFSRSDEYYFFVYLGEASPRPVALGEQWDKGAKKRVPKVRWESLLRSGNNGRRIDRPNLYYPVLISAENGKLVGFGDPLPTDKVAEDYVPPQGTIAVFPTSSSGSEACWRIGREYAEELVSMGAFRVGAFRGANTSFTYLKPGERKKIEDGHYVVTGYDDDGVMQVDVVNQDVPRLPSTQWNIGSHDAGAYGSELVKSLLPNRKFPFPKSLYAVEDSLRFFVKDKPNATILDFFSGSGTTAHAVMRLNKQDGGTRRSISVTNNEVSAEEQVNLRKQGLRPGDKEWEKWGICDYITKPRITSAITGTTPEGQLLKGDYKFTDEFPMAEGFPEKARFFTLSYLSSNVVTAGRAFRAVAPMLWLAAGQQGRVIDDLGENGWDVTDHYGVVEDIDNLRNFVDVVNSKSECRAVFIITDDDGAFELAAQAIRDETKTFRLYESYLSNFEIINR